MNCLPSKQALLPPYLCWLVDTSYSSSSFPPHILCTDLLLLASHILTFTAHFSLSFSLFFWITGHFLSHFLPQKMFLVPFPKKSLALNNAHSCLSSGQASRCASSGQQSGGRSGSVHHVHRSVGIPGIPGQWGQGWWCSSPPSDGLSGSCFQINRKKSVVLQYETRASSFFFFLLQVKRLLNWEGKCWLSYICPAKIHFSIYWMVNVLSNYLHILNKVTGHLEISSMILDKTKKDLWSGAFLIDRAKGDCLWKHITLKEIVFALLPIVLRSSVLAFI